MLHVLQRIAQKLIEREEERQRAGERIRNEIENLIERAGSFPEKVRVGAVDGGVLSEEYGPVILLIVRSVGAVFDYSGGRLTRVEYVPSPLPEPDVVPNDLPLEREDYHPFRSLNRLSSELRRAIEVLAREPDFLFLDGSVVPQMVDRPHDDRLRNTLYREVVTLFKELYSHHPDTIIAGFVKDSRGNRFGTYLQKMGIEVPRWQDISWLSYVLQPGEYTLPVPYSDDPRAHPTLKDLGDSAEKIYVMFIRPSPYDRPYRVEFYSDNPEEDARSIASVLIPLGALNPYYGVPPFLVEVDLRARVSRETLGYVKSYLERMLVAHFPSIKLFERRPM